MVSSAYLRLLIFLLAILLPACTLSSLAFHMIFYAYKLNKQDDNIQPYCIPLPVLNQSIFPMSNCFFLSCMQTSQETGKVTWYSHLCNYFPQFVVIHTVQMVNNPPAMWETWVPSLSWEDPLDGKIPWRREQLPTPIFLLGEFDDREAWQATVHGVTELNMTEYLVFPFHTC